MFPTHRDHEDAFVSVNGKTCWSKTGLVGTSGTQVCGGFFKEERFRVKDCYVTLGANAPLTVRVWTSLDSDAFDESFAIDNVVIKRLAHGEMVAPDVKEIINSLHIIWNLSCEN